MDTQFQKGKKQKQLDDQRGQSKTGISIPEPPTLGPLEQVEANAWQLCGSSEGARAIHIMPGWETDIHLDDPGGDQPLADALDAQSTGHPDRAETHLSEWQPAYSERAGSFQ